MHPVLGQIGPVTILTHDAFTVLALAVGLAIYYRELRIHGWLDGPIVWISLAAILVWRYIAHGLKLESLSYSAILGLLLIIVGFQTFCFTLLIEMAKRVMPRASA